MKKLISDVVIKINNANKIFYNDNQSLLTDDSSLHQSVDNNKIIEV
jgi:hypothetical protein